METATTQVIQNPANGTGKVRRTYRCSMCDRTFKRSEHCTRHERAHRQERPFACRYCHKKYARKDLVKRHERTLHADEFESEHRGQVRVSPLGNGNTCDHVGAEPQRDPNAEVDLDSSSSAPDCPPEETEMLQDEECDGMAAQLRAAANDLYPSMPAEMMTATIDFSMDTILDDFANGAADATQTVPATSAPFAPAETRVAPAASSMQQGSVLADIQHATFQSADPGFISPLHEMQSASANAFDPHLSSQSLNADMASGFMSDTYFDASMDVLLPNFPHADPSQLNGQGSSLQRRQSIVDSGMSCPYDGPTPTQELGFNRRIYEQLPRVLQESSLCVPSLNFDEAAYEALKRDIVDQLGNDGGLSRIASAKEIHRLLNSYVDCFHRHLPFLHLASMSLLDTPSALILAISSIGALYRLDRKRARASFDLASKIISRSSSDKAANDHPLWMSQAKVLLSFYAFFSGDIKVMTGAFMEAGCYTLEYRRIRLNMAMNPLVQRPSWAQWIKRESERRFLCALYIISNLIVTTFDVTPGFVNNTDLQFEAPEEETLWNAKTESEWKEVGQRAPKPCGKTVREIMAGVVKESQGSDKGRPPDDVPAFTMLVIMHAVCIHMWLSYQFSQVLSSTAFSLPAHRSLRLALLATTTSTLERCQQVISQRGTEDHEISWDDPEGPLLFNCQALLRIAYTRQFTIDHSFNRLTLCNPDPAIVLNAVTAYASARQARNQFLTAAAASACEGFLSVIRIGHMLVRKTAALNWSVEHAIAGWDSALFVTKWIHTVECESTLFPPDAEEETLILKLKSNLAEMEFEHEDSKSLAASVAKAWSLLLNDVWVWGVTPKMGFVLESLSETYQKRYEFIS